MIARLSLCSKPALGRTKFLYISYKTKSLVKAYFKNLSYNCYFKGMINLQQNTVNYLEIPVNLPGVPAILELINTVTKQTVEFSVKNLSKVAELYRFSIEVNLGPGEYMYVVKDTDSNILATGLAKIGYTTEYVEYNPDITFEYYDNKQ